MSIIRQIMFLALLGGRWVLCSAHPTDKTSPTEAYQDQENTAFENLDVGHPGPATVKQPLEQYITGQSAQQMVQHLKHVKQDYSGQQKALFIMG
jgi:hypothetical protein